MISVSSPAFSLMPFEQAIEKVAEDFHAWEIVAEGTHRLPDTRRASSILPAHTTWNILCMPRLATSTSVRSTPR